VTVHFSQLPESLERLQDALDLFGAFLVLAAEEGGEGFRVMRGRDLDAVSAGELANERDLVRELVRPGWKCWILNGAPERCPAARYMLGRIVLDWEYLRQRRDSDRPGAASG